MLRFDLDLYQVNVVVPGAGQPRTAAAVRAEQKAALAINGGFFDTDGRPLGLRIGDGKVILGLRRRVDWGVLLVRDGRAAIVHSRDYVADAAYQRGGPGRSAHPDRGTGAAAQATIGAPNRGRGRSLGAFSHHRRHPRPRLGDRLGERWRGSGFTTAVMFDGGPSTQLSASVGPFSLEVPGLYPVPDALFVVPRARPH